MRCDHYKCVYCGSFLGDGMNSVGSIDRDNLALYGLYLKSRQDVLEYLKAYKPSLDGGLWLSDEWDASLKCK